MQGWKQKDPLGGWSRILREVMTATKVVAVRLERKTQSEMVRNRLTAVCEA